MPQDQIVFISHASQDKENYIRPIAACMQAKQIPIWLDEIQLSWGDNLAMGLNEGLRTSQVVLICLSENYIAGGWPEAELSAALAQLNGAVSKRVLPLVLNSEEMVLQRYLILAGSVYRRYVSPEQVASDVEKLLGKDNGTNFAIVVRTVNTGKEFRLLVPPRVSIKWVISQVQNQFALRNQLDTGGFVPYEIRWILVDAQAKNEFKKLTYDEMFNSYVVAKTSDGLKKASSPSDSFDVWELRIIRFSTSFRFRRSIQTKWKRKSNPPCTSPPTTAAPTN